jgi:hypothetical protein
LKEKFEKKKYDEYVKLMKLCWQHDPKDRPSFSEIVFTLQEILENLNKRI